MFAGMSGLPAWLLWRAYYLSQMPTFGRKLRIFKGRTLLWRSLVLILSGPRGTMSRKKLDLWYSREAREQL